MPGGAQRLPRGSGALAGVVAVSIAGLIAFAPGRQADGAATAGPQLALTAPLPARVDKSTVLTVGDPVTQFIFEHNGWDRKLPFTIRWAQITGGPDVTEAFHARALDVGVGANVPPLHAIWVGLPVKIVAVTQRRDPIAHPAFVWGIAPGAGITRAQDLRGKRIAYSPSQVQGQIVVQTLKAAGLTTKDVTLVELPSSIGGDVYTGALASRVVDAAPIGGGIVAERYLAKYGRDGARTIDHPPFRDDLVLSYVPVAVLRDPAKAAALAEYVRWWNRAQAWRRTHGEEIARGYYQQRRGLSLADARMVIAAEGESEAPADWSEVRAYQQAAIDLLAAETGRPRFDAATVFDARFEPLATAPAALARR